MVNDNPFNNPNLCSMYFTSSNGLNVDKNVGIIGTEDFCIEYWLKMNEVSFSGQNGIIFPYVFHYGGLNGTYSPNNNGHYMNNLSNTYPQFNYYLPNGNFVAWNPNATPTKNVWYHIASVRKQGTFNYYINGVSKYTSSITTALVDTNRTYSNFFRIGYYSHDNSNYQVFNNYGFYLFDLRVTKGNPVYTGAFTPPIQPLTPVTGTQLLIC